MYSQISQMEPLFPAKTGALEDLAVKLVAASAKLTGRLAPIVLADIAQLLRVVNSYYSNLIEGHNTHPVDIERAMRQDYATEQDKRDLQLESLIHIEVQNKIADRLRDDPHANVVAPEFLCWLHQEFYHAMPERLRWVQGEKEPIWVEAGVTRTRMVEVGFHLAPVPDSLNSFLQRFTQAYDPTKMHGLRPLLALAAAHHRLMWIHPFLDGNGRVARLFTDAYFQRIALAGYGLWNVSRGLARQSKQYKLSLAAADLQRANDLDGRGNLSDRGLTEFCRFFLEVCLDQVAYMDGLLDLQNFLARLERYVTLRNAGMIATPQGQPAAPLPLPAGALLQAVAIRGEISRGEAVQILGKSERTGRNILRQLLTEELLTSQSEKGYVRLGFPAQIASHWFPELYPHEVR